MADLFTQLFPDDTKSADQTQNQAGFRFNAGPGGAMTPQGRTAGSTSDRSDRSKQKSKVAAVADQRTSSIIISAASEVMPQIALMVRDLDSSPARKQKVFVYDLANAEVQAVVPVLQDIFQRTTTSMNGSSSSQTSRFDRSKPGHRDNQQ